MKILHVTPHLGGGVGKAHAAIGAALPKHLDRTFLLLEPPRDGRHAAAIAVSGARVTVAPGLDQVAAMAAAADIVQIEFWNHPRLFACLARAPWPAMRSVFWSHISGLSRPVIQPGLFGEAGRFVFTTEASRAIPSLGARGNIAVINSGFGFADAPARPAGRDTSAIAYLGTVDFVKMHPGFFAAIDALEGNGIRATVWGALDPSGAVAARARAMRHPERIVLRGETTDPAAALSAAGIFFYPLQRDHYGTAENALIEAMSLGLVPVVLDNAAEKAIVRHGETGFVASSIEECTAILQRLLSSQELCEAISRNAMRDVAQTRMPSRSAREFVALWQGLLDEPKRKPDFRAVVGDSPAEWFLATQRLPGDIWQAPEQAHAERPSKGMLAHFEDAFPGDASLSGLRASATRPAALAKR